MVAPPHGRSREGSRATRTMPCPTCTTRTSVSPRSVSDSLLFLVLLLPLLLDAFLKEGMTMTTRGKSAGQEEDKGDNQTEVSSSA